MNDSALPTPSLLIQAHLNETISYAGWQNSVPLIYSLSVVNESNEVIEDVTLVLESSSGFLRPKAWTLPRIGAGETVEIADRHVELDPEYLRGVNESEKFVVSFVIDSEQGVRVEERKNVRLLAQNEWGGVRANAELIAAFVMPNDPFVASILKSASDLLERHGKRDSLEGYQADDPKRVYVLAGAIWNSISALDLTYANPPTSFETAGQKTRNPEAIQRDQMATCLDTSLLFCAALEAAGLHPIVVFKKGHCFTGVWLIEKTLNQVVETDVLEIRKALAGHELVTFETTLVTHNDPQPFDNAIRVAKAATAVDEESDFVAAIDIHRARMMQILPLASHVDLTHESTEVETNNVDVLQLPSAPTWLEMPGDLSIHKPTTPDGRIDRWQRKLLDLTLRNRLLNFRSTLQTVPILCKEIAKLEDLLANGKRLKFISLPEQNPLGERDTELHRQTTDSDLNAEFAIKALERKEVCCTLPIDQMEKRLITLYRAARNDMAEGGTNTLFLAVGFLRWKRSAGDKRSYRAPLLLVPIKLTRKSSQSPFHLRMHEDETRFNATLIQMLKQDFGKNLTRFESELPEDESGLDVPKILAMVRHHIRDVAGMEVVDECALGRFSFSKYLLWKDLVDRTDQLKNNRVVKHLLDGGKEVFGDSESRGNPIPTPQEMDLFEPVDLIHPLDADSSQLAAIVAAADGKDFVLIGPPGTGKSQTITNMIAQCLANGKSVLFVAEKTAALDVVHRRLVQHGLGDCCVELHSNKAERKKFLAQLEANWTKRKAAKNDWVHVNQQLKLRRDELNAYVNAINETQPNGWTAFDAFWESANGKSVPNIDLGWDKQVSHDHESYQKLERVATDLGAAFRAIETDQGVPCVAATEWSVQWERDLLESAGKLANASEKLKRDLAQFSNQIGCPEITDGTIVELDAINELAKALKGGEGKDLRILFHKKFPELQEACRELESSLEEFNASSHALNGDYGNELDRLPVDEIEHQWRMACSRFWPFSWFAKRRVTKLLNTYTATGTGAAPAIDLPAIKVIREARARIQSSPMNEASQFADGLKTDLDALKDEMAKATRIRDAIKNVGRARKLTARISKALVPVIAGQAQGRDTLVAASRFSDALGDHYQAVKRFAELAAKPPIDSSVQEVCATSRMISETVKDRRTELKRWTFWCGAKSLANAQGLATFANLLESKSITPEEVASHFRVAYARWLIPKLVDGNEILRSFETVKHEHAIDDFVRLDSLARKTASQKVLAAVAHDLPEPEEVTKKSELGLLRHQMQLKRPSKSIRDVVNGMPESFRELAPCLLMSPLSIAQYLPANQPPFDVVVFDEASQITTWDAIGAIARGKQTIIVGDPKQLPPTNFFGKIEDDEFDEELEEDEKDLESILDEAKASGLPELQLNWHYRSRHESLIAFSNYQYYGNRLITFPAADDDNLGVSLTIVPEAHYDLGKSRTNRVEAQAIVDNAMQRMERQLELPEEDRRTFGVITFNIQQQSLIQDLFEAALKKQPQLEWFFSDDRIEPTVVKNLENVQGDERDVMFFSITFGPTKSNPRVSLNFGALNKEGGHRRLNVAVTRSRQQMLIFSSFHPDQLDAARSQSRGLNDLKQFLQFAESKGELDLGSHSKDSVGGFDSPFEEAVSEALQMRGWIVVPQVGVSGFRIDLGIKHPHKPGSYLAGVECDGATYHRSSTARDRDKTRQLVLEGLGWNILRIWSPDWWYDPSGVAAKIHRQLEELLQQSGQESVDEAEAEKPLETQNEDDQSANRDSEGEDPPRISEDE